MAKRQRMKKIVLRLDALDHEAIIGAIKRRERLGQPHATTGSTLPLLPFGTSNREGAVIAEICRGWAEIVDGWKWIDGEPIDPDIAGKIKTG